MNYFIVNPISGAFSKKQREALYSLIISNPENVLWKTSLENNATTLTKRAIEKNANKIIAVGGDGTINEVGSTLVGTQIPLGIIPLGSGNGLARHLQLPLDFKNAYQKAISGQTIHIDAGMINGQYFFCTAGIGFDALVANRFAGRKNRGLINYILATINALIGYQSINVDINGEQKKLFSLSIANANQFGNNAYISPFSNIQDGTLELVQIQNLNLWHAFLISIRLYTKTIEKSSKVSINSFSTMQIKCPRKTYLHLDGEALSVPSEDLTIQIKPSSLLVII